MAWKNEVFVENEWAGNALVFETENEAIEYGKELLMRWWVPTQHRAVEVELPINYKWNDELQKAESIK